MPKRNLRCTAFVGTEMVSSGPLEKVALALKERLRRDATVTPLVFEDATARPIDLDLRGTDDAIVQRLDDDPDQGLKPPARAPGRPKLGVVPREVTLLPRHWDWLNNQPGGASVALRRLVDQARHADPVAERVRRAREATYRFMTALAGNEPGYEEATRALFAGDSARYDALIAGWPVGVRHYARLLSLDAFEEKS
ncbi:MAG: DUF2239 family protein [Reyranella sp.]|uniref:DUF2239 family protein n=1 Tax=Reyranella sp. TaxID=1929291 RepID=UPI001AD5AEC1|nr:DUF2239 family protein [Reyranella sp.]MBN9090864.1 DUF2239 family protein [Reyranella sp.]